MAKVCCTRKRADAERGCWFFGAIRKLIAERPRVVPARYSRRSEPVTRITRSAGKLPGGRPAPASVPAAGGSGLTSEGTGDLPSRDRDTSSEPPGGWRQSAPRDGNAWLSAAGGGGRGRSSMQRPAPSVGATVIMVIRRLFEQVAGGGRDPCPVDSCAAEEFLGAAGGRSGVWTASLRMRASLSTSASISITASPTPPAGQWSSATMMLPVSRAAPTRVGASSGWTE